MGIHECTYSKSMNQEYPRKCTICGKVEPMKTQFTTPCYVRIDDAQQRKEVCEKLEQMGYLLLPPPCTEDYRFSVRLNFAYLYIESRCNVPIYTYPTTNHLTFQLLTLSTVAQTSLFSLHLQKCAAIRIKTNYL